MPAVAPIDIVAADGVVEAARFQTETAQWQERFESVIDNRNEQIKQLFIDGMPGWLRSKLMEQRLAAIVHNLLNSQKNT